MGISKQIQHLFVGPFIHSPQLNQPTNLEVCLLGAIGVTGSGTIAFVERKWMHDPVNANKGTNQMSQELDTWLADLRERWSISSDQNGARVHVLNENQFLIPGFIDTHTHAPQYVNSGIGLDLPLLDWLERYTFPRESEFADLSVAERIYPACVRRHVSFGSTTCCYYGTIHLESTKKLVDIISRVGQRALVGKVNMDQNSPAALLEQTQKSFEETQKFVDYVLNKKEAQGLVTPVITPRFAPSCTRELMKNLGQLAKEKNIPIQSHLSENVNECKWVRQLFPECKNYASVYDEFGLLTDKTIMAHCIYLTEEERQLMRDRGVGVSHCPNSNFSISSGVCNVRQLWKDGIKVGLGTDVSGGHHPSMMDAVKTAILASKVLLINQVQKEWPIQEASSSLPKEDPVVPLTLAEAFYLGTLGSASICALDSVIGNFEEGKEFDALVVDLEQFHTQWPSKDEITEEHHHLALKTPRNHMVNNIDLWHHDDLLTSFEKFIYLGDDRNIHQVWVRGCLIKGNLD